MIYYLSCLWLSVLYVTSDPFFWVSMAFTTIMGIFIGAVVHDGDLDTIKKTLLSLFWYALLVSTVNITRVIPTLEGVTHLERPFASVITVILVTFFYLLGMFLGVLLVKKAHKGSLTEGI